MRRLINGLLITVAVSLPHAGAVAAQQLARGPAVEDIDTLRARLSKYSAYRSLSAYPYERHLDSLRRSIGDSVPIVAFWRSLQTVVGRVASWMPAWRASTIDPVRALRVD